MSALERLENRYLAGIVFEDATTGAPVTSPLRVASPTARFLVTTGGVYVVRSVVGLEAHTDFDVTPNLFEAAPATPAVGSVSVPISVVDPSGFYLPRLFNLLLPRSPDPTAANAVVEPVRIPVYRSLGAPLGPNWGTLDATVLDQADSPVRNAVARVNRVSDGALLGVGVLMAAGLTSTRTIGQLSIPIAGIPAVVWSNSGEDPVLQSDVAVLLRIVPISSSVTLFDPDSFLNVVVAPVGPFNVSSGHRENVGDLNVNVPL